MTIRDQIRDQIIQELEHLPESRLESFWSLFVPYKLKTQAHPQMMRFGKLI
jgi:hypothetical protein